MRLFRQDTLIFRLLTATPCAWSIGPTEHLVVGTSYSVFSFPTRSELVPSNRLWSYHGAVLEPQPPALTSAPSSVPTCHLHGARKGKPMPGSVCSIISSAVKTLSSTIAQMLMALPISCEIKITLDNIIFRTCNQTKNKCIKQYLL